jgi:hypothetical protein
MNVKHWIIAYEKNNEDNVDKFLENVGRVSKQMGFSLGNPVAVEVSREYELVEKIGKKINKNTQFVVSVCNKSESYCEIKELLYSRNIVSQSIRPKSL